MQLAKFGLNRILNLEYFKLKVEKVENGRKMCKPFSTFTFEIRNISNAKSENGKVEQENADSIRLNIENDAVRFGIFPFRFHP